MAPHGELQNGELSAAPGPAAAPQEGQGVPGSLPPGCQQLNQPGDLSACTRWTPQPVTVFASRLGSARVPSCGCPGGCRRAGSRGCHPSACCQLGAAGGLLGMGAARRGGLTEEILGRVLLVICVLGEVVDFLAHSSEGS